MTHECDRLNRKARAWLRQLSQELETDPDLIDAMPIEDIRSELQTRGIDPEALHTRLGQRVTLAKWQRGIQWISSLWQPQWAGQFVGAADIPAQSHIFEIPGGTVDITCSWKPQCGENIGYLNISWKVDTPLKGELWCQFIDPETKEILAEALLGTYREGGQYFTQQALGFVPAQVAWALSILLKNI